jgi:hypothetical protein
MLIDFNLPALVLQGKLTTLRAALLSLPLRI